ncbi:IS256 family transposase [Chitinophaga filiformis]|uniref:Mutator family transposase n=1 Tax=Chitinophaga filiformis TaxID=104663 RepID=A0ABY4I8P2_CHIFI|nr:IS256 family transposase [Chitinophaga filiformis]UPK72453.1 IS256 family transposase [Chitinophaga filiformis]
MDKLQQAIQEELANRLKSGKIKSSKDLSDLFHEMYRLGIQEMLKAEMDEHLGYEKHAPEGVEHPNSRNGYSKKKVKSNLGEVPLEVPRDRDASFEPQLVPKRSRVMAEIEDNILSLYTHGMTVRDIESHVRELYGVEMSEATISHITDRVIDHIEQWKNRRLERVYMVVWMDAIIFKVRQDGKVIDKAVQIAVGLNNNGYKEVLGMWICQNESAAFWMSVLTNLKARGVEDILITSTDNLKGFVEAIKSVYPQTKTQVCIVHQLRNSLKFVVWKDKKQAAIALREIYGAPDADIALAALQHFDDQWGGKYPYIVKSWRSNWDYLSTFFEFPLQIRKIIYTTNLIENVNRGIRKYTKARSILPSDQAVEKVVYLSLMQAQKKWTMPQRDWPIMLTQFINLFGQERCNLQL